MAKRGRPTKYNQKIADEICQAIASNGTSLRWLCKQHPNWPARINIYVWLNKYPEFRDQYMKARCDQIETYVDEIIEIADDVSHDTIINKEGNEVCNSEWINRSRLRIDTRKWLAAKLAPKLYGDQKKEEDNKQTTLMEKIIDKL